MLPVVHETGERFEGLGGDSFVLEDLFGRRSREGHEAFGEVDIKGVHGPASAYCVRDEDVQRPRLFGASAPSASSGMA